MQKLLWPYWIVAPLGLQLAACATTRPAHHPDWVAVLPFASLGASPATGPQLRAEMTKALIKQSDVRVVAQEQVDVAVDQLCGPQEDCWDCLEKNQRLLQLGRQLKAKWVVTGQLAAMGDRHALKLRVVDVFTNQVSTQTVSTTQGNRMAFLSGLAALQSHFPPKDPPKPWYHKWETWTIAGATITVIAILIRGALLNMNGTSSASSLDFDRQLP